MTSSRWPGRGGGSRSSVDVIEQSHKDGVDAFNRKITYVACRVADEQRASALQPRLSALEAAGIVTPNLGSACTSLQVHLVEQANFVIYNRKYSNLV